MKRLFTIVFVAAPLIIGSVTIAMKKDKTSDQVKKNYQFAAELLHLGKFSEDRLQLRALKNMPVFLIEKSSGTRYSYRVNNRKNKQEDLPKNVSNKKRKKIKGRAK